MFLAFFEMSTSIPMRSVGLLVGEVVGAVVGMSSGNNCLSYSSFPDAHSVLGTCEVLVPCLLHSLVLYLTGPWGATPRTPGRVVCMCRAITMFPPTHPVIWLNFGVHEGEICVHCFLHALVLHWMGPLEPHLQLLAGVIGMGRGNKN